MRSQVPPEQSSASSGSPTASDAAAAAANEALLAQSGIGQLYVRLLCEFEPAFVLPFLQSHDAYRVEEVLPFTERYNVADAQVPGVFSHPCFSIGATLISICVHGDITPP